MEKRKFGRSGEEISLLGFGTMRLPVVKADSQEIDEVKAFEMFDHALAHGINYFDTAYGYHDGQSEIVVGKALARHPRESFFLADKMPSWLVQTESDTERIFHEQLKKCQVEYFDFYLAHNMTAGKIDRLEDLKIYEFLVKMRDAGKIRHLGFSFHDSPAVLAKCLKRFDWEFGQIQLNYIDWTEQDAQGQYELLRDAGLSVSIMEPIRGGALAAPALPEEVAKVFSDAAPELSPIQWTLYFAGAPENVYTVLSGMSSMDQLRENIEFMSNFRTLTDTENAVIPDALLAWKMGSPIPCTGCRYCMPCPMGVDIPKSLSILNNYRRKKASWTFLQEMNMLDPSKLPHYCVGCRRCESVCPQKIEVSSHMEEMTEMLNTFEKPQWL